MISLHTICSDLPKQSIANIINWNFNIISWNFTASYHLFHAHKYAICKLRQIIDLYHVKILECLPIKKVNQILMVWLPYTEFIASHLEREILLSPSLYISSAQNVTWHADEDKILMRTSASNTYCRATLMKYMHIITYSQTYTSACWLTSRAREFIFCLIKTRIKFCFLS